VAQVAAHLVADDGLDVAGADEGLAHLGGVDVELDQGRPAGVEVALVVGRDVDDEGVAAPVHARVHGVQADPLRRLEARRLQGVDEALGEGRLILVHHRHRGVVQLHRHGAAGGVDGAGEGPDDEHQQQGVAL